MVLWKGTMEDRPFHFLDSFGMVDSVKCDSIVEIDFAFAKHVAQQRFERAIEALFDFKLPHPMEQNEVMHLVLVVHDVLMYAINGKKA